MKSLSAYKRPVLAVDDTVTVSLATFRLGNFSLKEIEDFCKELRNRGCTDHQSVDVEVGDVKQLSAKVGFEVVMPGD